MNAQEIAEKIGITVENTLAPLIGSLCSAAAVEIWHADERVYQGVFGQANDGKPVTAKTLFDLDALTEIFTTTAFLRLVHNGRIWIDTPVSIILPDIAKDLTFQQLLTHTSGLPATVDLCAFPDYEARIAAVLEAAPDLSIGPRYSPLDSIWIGLALEVLTSLPLAQAIALLTLQPLDLRAQFAPLSRLVSVAPINTQEPIEPLDSNARCLDDEAGHAGLFGTVSDVAALARLYLANGTLRIDAHSIELLSPVVALEATRAHAGSYGLGWQVSEDGFGYELLNGSFVWADPMRQLTIAVLVNSNPEHVSEPIAPDLIDALCTIVDQES